uniref:HECT-type E3 ubiquitin transferase n=1 Tax=Globisporangium ultimum (strain ATCC 200006 / CBS 805.95 / DAOM BR144) TaxID=431595 RepID=K3X449_GLOUD
MVLQGVSFGLASVALLVITLVIMWYIRRENNKDYDQMQLNAPLLVSEVLNREEAAAKEAELGFNKCDACGFENFKRIVFCNVCGEPIGEDAKKRVKKSKSSPNALSGRRLRASKRKEWLRKVDVEGRAYWYRQGTSSAESQFPGYVVTFDLNDQVAFETKGLKKTDLLIHEAQHVQSNLVESSRATPNVVNPLEIAHSYIDNELLEQAASLDFPSKYALFVTKSALALAPTKRQLLKLNITRKFMLEQSLDHVSCIDTKYARADLTIKFAKEPTTVTSNLQREWFVQLNELLGNPETGLFKLVNKSDQTFYLNPHSKLAVGDDHLTFYYSAGRLLGRGLLGGNIWGFHLATPLLKILLGIPVSFTDLAFFDPEAYKSLEYLVTHSDVESLGLDFSVTEHVNGQAHVVDLIPDGRNAAVTDTNKFEYLDRYFRYTLFESVESQLYAFLKGFYEVVPQELLVLFDPEEFDYVLCGSDVIDVDDWERHSKYNETIHAHPSKRWFWKFVRGMNIEYKKRLLHFTTGNTRVPIGGFAALTNYNGRLAPFTIVGRELVISRLIRGQPCFNHMELPMYIKKKELKACLFGILDNYEFAQ